MIRLSTIVLLLFCIISCNTKKVESESNLLPVIQKALNDSSSVVYGDFKKFPVNKSKLPIGVFDSGTGGMTVLEVLLNMDEYDNITGAQGSDGIPDLEGEDFTYFADLANMPYGMYSSENKDLFFKELVVKDALFLLGKKYYQNVYDVDKSGVKDPSKIIVIACNTATAYGLQEIDTLLKASGTNVKVIGVINAGVKALMNNLESDKKDSVAVGVLATIGTISSNAYEKEIKKAINQLNYSGFIKVVNQPGAGFAEAVDEEKEYVNSNQLVVRDSYRGPVLGVKDNDIKPVLLPVYNFNYNGNNMLLKKDANGISQLQLNSAANYARYHLVSLLEKHRKEGASVPMKHIILGCTHYPFLLDTLNKVIAELREYNTGGVYIYKNLIDENFSFIDPAVYTSKECYETLRKDNDLALRITNGNVKIFQSVPAFGLTSDQLDGENALSYSFKYGREEGKEDITTIAVPFSRKYVNEDVIGRIERMLPTTFSKIKNSID